MSKKWIIPSNFFKQEKWGYCKKFLLSFSFLFFPLKNFSKTSQAKTFHHVKKNGHKDHQWLISFKNLNKTAQLRQYVKKKQHLVCTKIPVQTNKNGNILKQKKNTTRWEKTTEENTKVFPFSYAIIFSLRKTFLTTVCQGGFRSIASVLRAI